MNENERLVQNLKSKDILIEQVKNESGYLLKKYNMLLNEKMISFNEVNQFRDK